MQGIRHETRYHTDEQIREAVAFARDLVNDLDLPEAWQPIALAKAIDLRVQKNITVEAVAAGLPTMAIPRGV